MRDLAKLEGLFPLSIDHANRLVVMLDLDFESFIEKKKRFFFLLKILDQKEWVH